jgi:tRNA A37 threonylcarbamoyltransferase TsaD
MIALAAAMRVQAGRTKPECSLTFDVKPRWALDEID